MSQWSDIPGVTAVDGRPRLPRDPEVAVTTLVLAFEGVATGGLTLPELVERSTTRTRSDRARVEGLAGWLPVSHVARWDPRTGQLLLDPRTDLVDMALRYAAWVSTQPVPAEVAEQSRAYARAIGELAARAATAAPSPRAGSRAPMPSDPGSPATSAPAGPLVDPGLTERIRTILAALDAAFLERRPHVRASLLALLAGQHVLLLGPPGTAKSLLARALCEAFEGARYFEYLLSRFTHPDELFGPVSIPGLKDEDYRRLTEGFLPRAHVAFLDEIFKANSAILNSLLTLVNERVFHHGRHRDAVPLVGVVGASNELPDPDGGLGALYDRFLVRLTVPPLAGAEAFLRVATGAVAVPRIPDQARITEADRRALIAAADAVGVPPEIADALVALWRAADRHQWQVSDRRWRQAVHMLKVGAAADGRSQVGFLDLLLLEPVLCDVPDRAAEVREAILERIGTTAVPEHDLRTQWLLLGMDRVAPIGGDGDLGAPAPGTPWPARIQARRAHAERFLAHHAAAVRRLGADRSRVEDLADHHLWLASLPAQVLAAHIEASRELVGMLRIAEAYRDALATDAGVARALLESLPLTPKRVYGHGAVCALHVDDAGIEVGITLAGEREPLPEKGAARADGLTADASDVPRIRVSSHRFLDWVDGQVPAQSLLTAVPAFSSRNAATALQSVRRLLRSSAVPVPPEIPVP